MTQITHTTQPGDIVVIVPISLIKAIGFLAVFCGFAVSFLMFAAGYVMEGVFGALLTVGAVPIWLLFHYFFWRFHWYLLLISMICSSTMCAGSLLLGLRVSPGVARSQFGSVAANFLTIQPASGMIALLVAAIITAALYRMYTLWRTGGPDQPAAAAPQPADDIFDAPATEDLMARVVGRLERAGGKTDIKGDLIHVYRSGTFAGIVCVMDRPGAISPLIVRDVAKQRDRLGVKTAYIATSGSFTADVRALAAQLGIQLMTV